MPRNRARSKGNATLSVSAIVVEIDTDDTLRGDKFRVEAVWGVGQDDEKTVILTPTPEPVPPDKSEDTAYEPDDEGTAYEPFYTVEVWRDGKREGVFGATAPEIVIGRKKSGSVPDVSLTGDVRVSGVHARLRLDETTGRLWLKAESRNATHVDGRAYRVNNAETEIRASTEIKIYDFTLKIVPGTHLADETWKME